MDLVTAGLHRNTFRVRGEPLAFIQGRSQEAAFRFLQQFYLEDNCLGVFQGPRLIGKTTVVQRFVRELNPSSATAVVDCQNLDCGNLLARILEQFEFHIDQASVPEQLEMISTFLVRQTVVFQAPLIVIDNAHAMSPAASRAFGQLVGLHYRNKSALRVVLVSDGSLDGVIAEMGLRDVARRRSDTFHMGSMTVIETGHYLYTKLRAGGCERPETLAAKSLLIEAYQVSGGVPGLIDQHLLLRIKNGDKLPLAALPAQKSAHKKQPSPPANTAQMGPAANKTLTCAPMLLISLDGKTLQKFPLNRPRFLIGRSDVNDITLDGPLISRHHALLIRQNGVMFILDLNSTNGVFINSKRMVSQTLRHDDVVKLGNHVIKLHDPGSRNSARSDAVVLQETQRMKILDDMRQLQARKNTHAAKP